MAVLLFVKPPAPSIEYEAGEGNPLTYSGDGSSTSHLVGFLYGGGQDDGYLSVYFRIKKAGVLRYEITISSESDYDFGYLFVGGSFILSSSGFEVFTGSINVNVNDLIEVSYIKDGSVTEGFDGVQFDFYIA